MPESNPTANAPENTVIVRAAEAGQRQTIQSVPGGNLRFEGIDPAASTFSRPQGGNDLVITQENGGSVVVQNYFQVGDSSLPTLTLADGSVVQAADFFSGSDLDISTAAGPAAAATPPGGGTSYDDNGGALLSGVDKFGMLGTDYWARASEIPELYVGNDLELPGGAWDMGIITPFPDGAANLFSLGLYEDSRPLQHQYHEGTPEDVVSHGQLVFSFTPTGTTQVTSVVLTGFPQGTVIFIGDPDGDHTEVVSGGPDQPFTFSYEELTSIGVYVRAPENSDADFTLNAAVNLIAASSGMTGVIEESFTVVVDAVADLPLIELREDGYPILVTPAEDQLQDAGKSASTEAVAIDIPVKAEFFDFLDGSEKHYLIVEDVPAGWSLIADTLPDGWTLLQAGDPLFPTDYAGNGWVLLIPDGVSNVEDVIQFNPGDWTNKRDADGNLHVDPDSGEPVALDGATVTVKAAAWEYDPQDGELRTDNNFAITPDELSQQYLVGIPEDEPAFVDRCGNEIETIRLLSDETPGIQRFTDETSMRFVSQDVKAVLAELGLADQKPVSVADKTIRYDLKSDGIQDPNPVDNPHFGIGFEVEDGADSGWRTTATAGAPDGTPIFLYQLPDGNVVGREGVWDPDANDGDGGWVANPQGDIALVVTVSGATFDNGYNNADITFIQYKSLQHPTGGDSHNESMEYPLNLTLAVYDDEGDRAAVTVNINVRDDGPSAGCTVTDIIFEDSLRCGDVMEASGLLAVAADFGADGAYIPKGDDDFNRPIAWDADEIAEEFGFYNAIIDGEAQAISKVEFSADKTTFEAYAVDDSGKETLVAKGTVSYDPLTGKASYQYEQYRPLEHGEHGTLADSARKLDLTYTLMDGDGDTASGQIDILVVDSHIWPKLDAGHVDESLAHKGIDQFIPLTNLDYAAPDGLVDVTWNRILTEAAIQKLGLRAVGHENTKLTCVIGDADGKVLIIMAGDVEIAVLTLVEDPNRPGQWGIDYDQKVGLDHPLGGIFHDDPLLLPLVVNSHDGDRDIAPNLVGVIVDDDGPRPLVDSNVDLIGSVGNSFVVTLYEKLAETMDGFKDYLNEDGSLNPDFWNVDAFANGVGQAFTQALGESLSGLSDFNAVRDVLTLVMGKDYTQLMAQFTDAGVLALLSQAIVALATDNTEGAKTYLTQALQLAVQKLPADDARTEHEGVIAENTIQPDYGFDGPAATDAVKWDVNGIKAMLAVLGVKASGDESVLSVQVNSPTELLLLGDSGQPVLTLSLVPVDSANLALGYTYTIEQHAGLEHSAGPVETLLSGLIGDNLDGVLNTLLSQILSGLGTGFSGLDNLLQQLDIAAILGLDPQTILENLGSGNLLNLPLPILITDGDGDVAPGLIHVAIRDSVPTLEIGDGVTVSETDLNLEAKGIVGTDADQKFDNRGDGKADDDETVATGSFAYTMGFDASGGTVTVTGADGVAYAVAVGAQIPGLYGSMKITSVSVPDANGKVTVEYTYTLTDRVQHEAEQGHNTTIADGLDESFKVTVTDGDNDAKSGDIKVSIIDDVPQATDNYDVLDAPTVTGGDWTASGNILTGQGTFAARGGDTQAEADKFGADNRMPNGLDDNDDPVGGLRVQLPDGSWKVVDENAPTVIAGKYGDLTLHHDGTYTYTVVTERMQEALNTPGAEANEPLGLTVAAGSGAVAVDQADIMGLVFTGLDTHSASVTLNLIFFSVTIGYTITERVQVSWTDADGPHSLTVTSDMLADGRWSFPAGAFGITDVNVEYLEPTYTTQPAVPDRVASEFESFINDAIATLTENDCTIESAVVAAYPDPSDLTEVFDYKIYDKDGDSDAAQLIINANAKPGTPSAIDKAAVVAEQDLAAGTDSGHATVHSTDHDKDTPGHNDTAFHGRFEAFDFGPEGANRDKPFTWHEPWTDPAQAEFTDLAGNPIIWKVSADGLTLTGYTTSENAPLIVITASGVTGDAPTYQVNLLGPINHVGGNAVTEQDFEVSYSIADRSGDTADGALTITILDDAPAIEIVSGKGTDGDGTSDGTSWQTHTDDDDIIPGMVSGESITGQIDFTGGADGLADQMINGVTGTLVVSDGTNRVAVNSTHTESSPQVLESDYGTLKIWYDGDGVVQYSFKADNASGADQELAYTFSVVDKDGDTASDTLSITVEGTVILGFGDGLVVDESYLAIAEKSILGTKAGEMFNEDTKTYDPVQAEGSFLLTSTQLALLTVDGLDADGKPATFNVADLAENGTHVYSEHGYLTFSAVDDGSGKLEVTYTFTLTDNYDKHPDNYHSVTEKQGDDGEHYNANISLDDNGANQPGWSQNPDDGDNYWDESSAPAGDQFTFKLNGEAIEKGTLQITIEDDGISLPSEMSGNIGVEETNIGYNLVLCLDLSTSMLQKIGQGSGSRISENSSAADFMQTRLFASVAAALTTLEAYKDQAGENGVNISLVGFNKDAIPFGPFTSYQAAYDAISSVLSGFTVHLNGADGKPYAVKDSSPGTWPIAGTSYTKGLDALAGLLEPALGKSGETRVYFLSDGEPYPTDAHSSVLWTTLMQELGQDDKAALLEHLELYTVGIAGVNSTNFSGVLKDVPKEIANTHVEIPKDAVPKDYIDAMLNTVGGLDGDFPLPDAADGVINGKAFVYSVTYEAADDKIEGGPVQGIVIDGAGFPSAKAGEEISDQSVSVKTEYGTFVFRADGTYTFKPSLEGLKGLPPEGAALSFTVTFMDADGDTRQATFEYAIAGKPIEKPSIDGDGGALTVAEGDISYGANDAVVPAKDDGSLQINFDSRAGLDKVVLAFTLEEDGQVKEHAFEVKADGTEYELALPNGTGTLYVTCTAGGEVTYRVELNAAENHITGTSSGDYLVDGDEAVLNMTISAVDGKGNASLPLPFTVTIVDDEPSISIGKENVDVLSGRTTTWVDTGLDIDGGADGVKSLVLTVKELGIELEGEYDEASGSWTFTHPESGASIVLDANGTITADLPRGVSGDFKLTFTVTDEDGDVDDASLTIRVSENTARVLQGTYESETLDVWTKDQPNADWLIIGDQLGQTTIVQQPSGDYNVSLILDLSSSMGYSSGVSGKNRLDIAKDAIKSLLTELADLDGTVNVQLVTFGNNATNVFTINNLSKGDLLDTTTGSGKNATTIPGLLSQIDAIRVPSGAATNYEAGFVKAQAWLETQAAANPEFNNKVFFMTDGDPTRSNSHGNGSTTTGDVVQDSYAAFQALLTALGGEVDVHARGPWHKQQREQQHPADLRQHRA